MLGKCASSTLSYHSRHAIGMWLPLISCDTDTDSDTGTVSLAAPCRVALSRVSPCRVLLCPIACVAALLHLIVLTSHWSSSVYQSELSVRPARLGSVAGPAGLCVSLVGRSAPCRLNRPAVAVRSWPGAGDEPPSSDRANRSGHTVGVWA